MRKERSFVFLKSIFGFSRPKTKGQLVLIILIHILGWLLFFSLPLFFYNVEIAHPFFLLREAADKILLIVFFYFNYFFLLPKFLERKRPGPYLGFVTGAIVLLITQQVMLERYFFDHFFSKPDLRLPGVMIKNEIAPPPMGGAVMFQAPVHDSAGPGPNGPFKRKFTFATSRPFVFMAANRVFSSVMLLALLGAFIRLSFTYIKQQDEKKALENATLNAEMNLLKSQVNPHFLFNTLNTIYAQAHARSGSTEHSVMKLSDILRHVLYESSDKEIDLNKEIQYIGNYIELQRMRINSKVEINYRVNGQSSGLMIAPLLLITFIENAFKYGVSYANPSAINILISISNHQLDMVVQNTVIINSHEDEGGIGLNNARRRLELIYPERHSLKIAEQNNIYTVKLKIDLQ